jgi:hypothetical protein
VLAGARLGAIRLKPEMGSMFIIVVYAFFEHTSQMSLMEDDVVSEAIPAYGTGDSLDVWILPRGLG